MSSSGDGSAIDQLGHSSVVPGMFGRSVTSSASSSVPDTTALAASPSAR
jgi:hypothetical protein